MGIPVVEVQMVSCMGSIKQATLTYSTSPTVCLWTSFPLHNGIRFCLCGLALILAEKEKEEDGGKMMGNRKEMMEEMIWFEYTFL